jgi:hypothetical protein
MKKTDKQSIQKTLLFATTVATLGASVGVTVSPALAAPPPESTLTKSANQLKIDQLKKDMRANQLKIEQLKKSKGAKQLKIEK